MRGVSSRAARDGTAGSRAVISRRYAGQRWCFGAIETPRFSRVASTAVGLQVLAGLRQGEVRALEVGDLDLEHGLLTVRRAYSEQVVVMPKGNRQRVVPMHADLVSIVQDAIRHKLGRALVITDENGRPVSRQHYLARLKAAQRHLGLKEWSSHALRHFFCSELTRSGANVEAVRALAGHSNISTTQRYLHATGGDLVHAIRKLGNGVETT